MRTNQYLGLAMSALLVFSSTTVFATAGDTAIANLNVSGTVPAVFSVQARGIPGDLDLTPGAIVKDRVIGLWHFKYNEDAASIKVSSSTASGGPEEVSAGQAYTFGASFKVGAIGTCVSLAAPFKASGGDLLVPAGVDYSSALAKDLTTNVPVGGVEEDCQIAASWTGTATTLPLAGVYAMTVTVTMVAN
jgi:hypothetical protein